MTDTDRHRSDVLVVGGGVVGCAIAYELARRGLRVTLLERQALGGAASGAAAGILAPVIEAHQPGPFLDLAVASLQLFPALAAVLRDETGLDVEYRESGILRVAYSEDEALAMQARLDWQRESGLPLYWLDGTQARSLEPGLAPGLRGAVYSPREGHVLAPRLAPALARAAAQRGATIVQGCEVTGLAAQGDRIAGARTVDGGVYSADHIVLAPGAWTQRCGEWIGLSLPVYPVRGQILALRALAPPLRHIVWGADAYIVPKADGTIAIGATEDRAGFAAQPTARGVLTLLQALPGLLPELLDVPFSHAWAGLRPCTPDGLPIIGPAPGYRNVTIAAGHYRNGILLSPITARLVAQLIAGEQTDVPLAPFSPRRFEHRPLHKTTQT